MTSNRSAIILSIDGLGARSLGAYGNTWYRTPQFNRFAAASVLFEHAFATAPDSSRDFWRMISPLEAEQNDLFRRLDNNGTETVMLSDDAEVCEWAASRFERVVLVPGEKGTRAADDWTETESARFFSAAADEIENLKVGSLLWMHSRGMFGSWDAPTKFRTDLAEEDDPAPPEFVETPCKILPDDFDPDEVLGIQQAYGAQVHLVDECLGIILDQLDELPVDRIPLFVVHAPRGFPLGEHRVVGEGAACVYDESLHVPLMIRHPDARWAASRCLDLVTSANLTTCVVEWLESHPDFNSRNTPSSLPERKTQWTVAKTVGQRAVRTHAWKLITDGNSTELYTKPDDRWEQNNVRSLCPEVVDQLNSLLALPADDAVQSNPTPSLPDSLAFGAS